MSNWQASKAKRVRAALERIGWRVKFAFHDSAEIGPKMLARIAKDTGPRLPICSPAGWLLIAIKRIAGLNSPFLHPSLKPVRALRGRPMRKRFRAHLPARHALQSIVSDGCRRLQACLHVARIDDLALFGGFRPNSGEAIGLEFQPHRERVDLRAVPFLRLAHLRFDAENLLHVVTEFMGDHVGLRKFARRSETLGQFVEESEIEIDFLVAGTIERPGSLIGRPTSGRIGVAEQDQFGVTVAEVGLLRQKCFPGMLHVVENKRYKLHFALLAGSIHRRRGAAGRRGYRSAASSSARE